MTPRRVVWHATLRMHVGIQPCGCHCPSMWLMRTASRARTRGRRPVYFRDEDWHRYQFPTATVSISSNAKRLSTPACNGQSLLCACLLWLQPPRHRYWGRVGALSPWIFRLGSYRWRPSWLSFSRCAWVSSWIGCSTTKIKFSDGNI